METGDLWTVSLRHGVRYVFLSTLQLIIISDVNDDQIHLYMWLRY